MKRCAIYTRKSTEEGLDQDFNSLDAQREACEAYIKSQKHEGWKLVGAAFDDGGLSGGSMDRPALLDLLRAIERHEIDVVVVYKVDRLTRSLADFAKIVELFDTHDVSFVSVTQQFNTTSSMGRLTLNVLLSFAQFEREVTAERIRDKITASKKNGMWMGGPVPLGYDAKDRKLIINDTEAKTIRTLYELYLEHGTVRLVKEQADRLGLLTKRRTSKAGNVTGGKPFSRGNLYEILCNPTYVGLIPSKGNSYPGQHKAIVDDATWYAVQEQLNGNATSRSTDKNTPSCSLLTGLVHDETGDPLTPTYTSKKGRRYRYYISNRLNIDGRNKEDGWRLSARTLEPVILNMLRDWLDDERSLSELFADKAKLSPRRFKGLLIFRVIIESGEPGEQRTQLQSVIDRIDLTTISISLTVKRDAFAELCGVNPDQLAVEAIVIQREVALRRRGVERRIVLVDGMQTNRQSDPSLCKLIALARNWFNELSSGEMESVDAIAARENRDGSDISRVLQLAFLAPDIVEAILAGRQPIHLNSRALTRLGTLPSDWQAQRRLFGFAA